MMALIIIIVVFLAAGYFLAPIAFTKFVIFGGAKMSRADLEDMKSALKAKSHICGCMEKVVGEFKSVQMKPGSAYILCKAYGKIEEFMKICDKLSAAINHTAGIVHKSDTWWLKSFRKAGRDHVRFIDSILHDDIVTYGKFHKLYEEIGLAEISKVAEILENREEN